MTCNLLIKLMLNLLRRKIDRVNEKIFFHPLEASPNAPILITTRPGMMSCRAFIPKKTDTDFLKGSYQ